MGCNNSSTARKRGRQQGSTSPHDATPSATPTTRGKAAPSDAQWKKDAEKYWDAIYGGDVDFINASQFALLFDALDVDAAKADSFLFVFLLDCQGCWTITKEEYATSNVVHDGRLTTRKGVAEALQDKKSDLKASLEEWRKFNIFSFNFCRNSSSATIIPTEEALPIMEAIVQCGPTQNFPFCELSAYYKDNVGSMSRDLWKQTFKFVREIKPDLSNYSEMQCWHTEIDEFVEKRRADSRHNR